MPSRQISPLLELDPDLGVLLPAERIDAALHDLRVVVHTLDTGTWNVDELSGASPEHLGLLVLDGVFAREVLVSDTVSTELLGPGDVVRPWRLHSGAPLLQHQIRWSVLARSRFALLDRRVGVELARYPEVNAAIIDRVNERALRLAVTQAISQLNRVDRRLLAFFWHLAERWGRMTPNGVALPLTLSHRMLGQLVGARRPTVSTALRALDQQGEVARRDDGTWLLTGAPVGVPEPGLAEVIPMRRHLLRAESPAPPPEPAELPLVHVRGVELRTVLQALREKCQTQVNELREIYLTTTVLAERSNALRDACRVTRERAARTAHR